MLIEGKSTLGDIRTKSSPDPDQTAAAYRRYIVCSKSPSDKTSPVVLVLVSRRQLIQSQRCLNVPGPVFFQRLLVVKQSHLLTVVWQTRDQPGSTCQLDIKVQSCTVSSALWGHLHTSSQSRHLKQDGPAVIFDLIFLCVRDTRRRCSAR